MNPIRYSIILLCIVSALTLAGCSGALGDETVSENELACLALTSVPNLTLTSAELVPATESTPQYCYVKGLISPASSTSPA